MIDINIKVPKYETEKGFEFNWYDGFEIKTAVDSKTIHLKANKAGLMSLANHLVNLAQDNIPKSYHIHLDEFNSLEDGSVEIIIEKK